jgi:sugar diacid utilization regulator
MLEDAQWRLLSTAGTQAMPQSARSVVEAQSPGRATRVLNGETHLGWLSLFGTNAQTGGDLLLRLTAAAIGPELARNGAPRSRGSFWSRLFEEHAAGANTLREEAAATGITPAAHYCVVVLEADAPAASSSSELQALASQAFAGDDADRGFCARDQRLYVFVPAARAVDASNTRTAASLLPRAAARRKSALAISGGVGTVESIATVRRSIATADAALAIGRRVMGIGHVPAYDALGAYPLLYEGVDVPRLRAFADTVLAPLRAYDAKHQTELERTLKLYFDVGQNVKTASERLNVHRHTVFYRLRQIAEISSRSLDNAADQLTFRLAIAVDELHA